MPEEVVGELERVDVPHDDGIRQFVCRVKPVELGIEIHAAEKSGHHVVNAEVFDLFFLLLAIRDVAADADEAGELAFVIEERRFERLRDHQAPVGELKRLLTAHLPPEREHFLVLLNKGRRGFVIKQLKVRFTDQPFFADAGCQLKRAVCA